MSRLDGFFYDSKTLFSIHHSKNGFFFLVTFSPNYITFPYTKSADPFLLYGVFMTLFLEWTILSNGTFSGCKDFLGMKLSPFEMDQSHSQHKVIVQ